MSDHILGDTHAAAQSAHQRKRRIVIPSSFREALGIQPGDELILSLDDDELSISTLKSRIARAQRHARQYARPGKSIVSEFLAERREGAKLK